MKVIGINGSGRKDGNTAILIRTIFEELEKQDIETELVQLADKPIKGCTGCYACHKAGNKQCVIKDDSFNECFNKMIEADGIILGSPVYSCDVSAQIKAFCDRSGMVIIGNPGVLKHKVCASVCAVRRGGGSNAVDTLNHFLLNKETILVGSTYWNMVYGRNIGEVLQDEEGMRNMRNIGQNMAWLMKKLHE